MTKECVLHIIKDQLAWAFVVFPLAVFQLGTRGFVVKDICTCALIAAKYKRVNNNEGLNSLLREVRRLIKDQEQSTDFYSLRQLVSNSRIFYKNGCLRILDVKTRLKPSLAMEKPTNNSFLLVCPKEIV